LAGAIEAAPDAGTAWREDLTHFLEDEFSFQVFDPSLHEMDFLTDEERQEFRKWKTTDINRFRPVIEKIIERDLQQLLNECDAVICLWDEYVMQGAGTHGELTLAYEHKLPVYLIMGMELEKIPSWIIGCTSEIFKNFSEMKQYFRKNSSNLSGQ
jgi:nucleoside 2-deoxyribosyltransferase